MRARVRVIHASHVRLYISAHIAYYNLRGCVTRVSMGSRSPRIYVCVVFVTANSPINIIISADLLICRGRRREQLYMEGCWRLLLVRPRGVDAACVLLRGREKVCARIRARASPLMSWECNAGKYWLALSSCDARLVRAGVRCAWC